MSKQFLPDVEGPDCVRVTIAVETAAHRVVRARELLGLRAWYLPFNRRLHNKLVRTTQEKPLRDRWAVTVEADSGQRLRLVADDHASAVDMAHSVSADVRQRGVAAVTERRDS